MSQWNEDNKLTEGVLDEVLSERQRQRSLWGNSHDDAHSLRAWNGLLGERTEKIDHALGPLNPRQLRRELLILAALAVAFIEVLDRTAWDPANFEEVEAADDD